MEAAVCAATPWAPEHGPGSRPGEELPEESLASRRLVYLSCLPGASRYLYVRVTPNLVAVEKQEHHLDAVNRSDSRLEAGLALEMNDILGGTPSGGLCNQPTARQHLTRL